MEPVMVLGVEGEGDDAVYRVRSILTSRDVDEAVSGGLEIYSTDERGGLDRLLYDGEGWTSEERPDIPTEVIHEVPSVPYVDQRVDLLQAEVEALTDALLQVDPGNVTALSVKSLAPDARIALAFDEEADMDEVIASLRTPVKEAK